MKRNLLLGMLALLIALPGAAAAQQLFDFSGYAMVPDQPGGMLSMYSVLRDPFPGETPLPFDFGTYEYTLVVADLIWWMEEEKDAQTFHGGSIEIWRDVLTPADTGDLATYVDGDLLLSGVFVDLTRTPLTDRLGSVRGTVNWMGGSELDEFAPEDQHFWPFVAAFNTDVQGMGPQFDERWDGKVEPTIPVVPGEDAAWGAVKSLYR